jgi:hypothetical protein
LDGPKSSLSHPAGLMLGRDKSRGYCLEMICADFLAGASLEPGEEQPLFPALDRLIGALQPNHRLPVLLPPFTDGNKPGMDLIAAG